MTNRMNSKMPLVVASLLALQSGVATAQQGMDMAVMQKWTAAKVVRYRVEGVHAARVSVVFGDYEGKADVTDRVIVEFNWDVRKNSVVGPVKVTDGKSELRNLRSDKTNCPPPQLKGEYEHFQSVSNSMTTREQIQIKGTRTYPPASVSNYPGGCSMRAIPGGKEEKLLWLGGTGPEALGMPNMKGSPVTIAADRKSFSMKGAENWVWTYTPTLVE
jgi:hypothetical protein